VGETDWGADREEGEVVDVKGWESASVEEINVEVLEGVMKRVIWH
jgi:hypothetical protein